MGETHSKHEAIPIVDNGTRLRGIDGHPEHLGSARLEGPGEDIQEPKTFTKCGDCYEYIRLFADLDPEDLCGISAIKRMPELAKPQRPPNQSKLQILGLLSLICMDESQIREGEYMGYRVSVRLIREGDREFRPRALNSSREAYEFYRDLASLDREAFYSTHLDQRNQVLSCEEISRGTLSASLVHPREVFKSAILSSAAGIIISHNHPSGNPAPSHEDWELTSRLAEAGRLLGIPLLDSIIIGHERYYSMRDEGRL